MLFLLLLLLPQSCPLFITLSNSSAAFAVTDPQGTLLPQFTPCPLKLTCRMPELFVYGDSSHSTYNIVSEGGVIVGVTGKYKPVTSEIECRDGGCVAVVGNGCAGGGINWIAVRLEQGVEFEYLVDCQPGQFYKPFEWGLFILIFFCTLSITVVSFYSRTWAYRDFGIDLTKKHIMVFNILFVVVSVLAYLLPHFTSLALKIISSLVGILGVMVCSADALWLLRSRKLNQQRVASIRLLDVVGFLVGLGIVVAYWCTGGVWILNDVLAVSVVVAGMKVLKLRSLKDGVFMLFSLLLIEIVVGLWVHYRLQISFNAMVIQMFQSPLVLVLPSITPELYRKCAWLPVTSILFPGLFISYLRRFDKSRSTMLYLLIGYISFYIGSILWMVVDLNTVHSLPLAIISDPVVVASVYMFAMRRNELKTIWTGRFYDTELASNKEKAAVETGGYVAFMEITEGLRIGHSGDEI